MLAMLDLVIVNTVALDLPDQRIQEFGITHRFPPLKVMPIAFRFFRRRGAQHTNKKLARKANLKESLRSLLFL
jgi:hypothetical protein